MAVHSTAQKGFEEGTNEVYDRARPSYPSSALAYIRQSISKDHSLPFNIVEVGAGTGIFTRALLGHPDWSSSIREIRAVDPSAGMRAQFEKKVIATLGSDKVKISVKDGSFSDTGIEDGWADIVILAQAWHWAGPNYDAGTTEFARILKPFGTVVFAWNLEDMNVPSSPWVATLRHLWEKYESGAPQFRQGKWRDTFDPAVSPNYPTLFEQPLEETFDWIVPTTKDAVIERVRSKSFIAVLEREKKEEYIELVEKMREVLNDEEKSWIDMERGLFEYPYKTTVVVARKK